jgi:hypothetical protein
MTRSILTAVVLASGLTAAVAHAGADCKKEKKSEQGAIDPQADAALKRMSAYVGDLKSFRVDATTIDEKITTGGEKIQELKQSKIAVRRPDGMWIDRTGPKGHAVFRWDGKEFTLFLPEKNTFATEKAPDKLDAAIDDARDRLGIDAPGADLIVSDSYHALLEDVVSCRYIGLERIDGMMAHHLAMVGNKVDWQLWIADGPMPVPLRYVITSKDMTGQPQFTIELHNWKPDDASLTKQSFAFVPPPDATRMSFTTPEKKS